MTILTMYGKCKKCGVTYNYNPSMVNSSLFCRKCQLEDTTKFIKNISNIFKKK